MPFLDPAIVLSVLLNGLTAASTLFIVSSGLSLIFGVTQIVNFAHGSLYMLGAYMAFTMTGLLPAEPVLFWVGVAGAVAAVALVGGVAEMSILRRLYKAPELLQLLATYGVVLIIQDATKYIWGYEDLIGPRVPGLRGAIEILGVQFPTYNLLVICLAPAILGLLWLTFHKTRWGVLVRAGTEDREMLGALGVNQKWLFTSVFVLGSALAALGGALQLPRDAANLGMDFNILTEAFVVVVVGGLGSVVGAFFAALLIGVLQAFGTVLLPKFTLVLIFLIMTLVLLVRPYGLAGRLQVQVREQGPSSEHVLRPGGANERWLWISVVAGVMLFAFLHIDYTVTVVIEMLIFVLFAVSLHFLVGVGGILSFGHAAYFGLGAYFTALGVKYFQVPMVLALIGAPLAAAAGAALFGWLCVRLNGVYRAMLTLALAQILWSIAWQWTSVTGGDNGILQVWPAAWARDRGAYLYLVLALVVAGVVAIRRLTFSPLGYALRAGRDAPQRAEAIGIDVRLVQWAAFVVAGAFAGVAGALFAYFKGSVFPDTTSIPLSVDGLLMIILGGLNTMVGPIVGAIGFHALLTELQRATEYWRSILGVVIILLVILFPNGIGGSFDRLRGWSLRRAMKATQEAR
jgi:branched-chain amino acid transport system permease protein